MRTLRLISLWGLLGSVGTALAIGLAATAKPPAAPSPPAAASAPAAPSAPAAASAPAVTAALAAPLAIAAPAAPAAEPCPPASAAADSAPTNEAEGAISDLAERALPEPAPEIVVPVRDLSRQQKLADADPPHEAPPLPPALPAEIVAPYPKHTQQMPAPLSKETVRQLSKLAGQLAAEPALAPADGGPPAAPVPPALPALPQALQELQKLAAPPERPAAEPVPAPAGVPNALKPRGQITAAPDGEGDQHLQIFFPETEIREILDSLSAQGNLNILASKNVSGKLSLRLSDVDVEGALDAVLKATGLASRRDGKFIYVGTADEFISMEQSLDRIGTRVYRPNYVSAAEMQALIQPLLTERTGVVSVSTAAESGIATDAAAAGGNKFAGGEVVLVRDYEAVLAQVDQVVDEIDVRPMQVAIESMILSVKLDDTDKLGIDWQFLLNSKHVALALGMPAAALPTTFATGGLHFAYLDGNLGSFIEALQEYKEANVIATPRLMVLNKQKAEIQIGQQQGYVNTTVTETSSTQTVQMMDTGTILRLRPFISTDGLVRVEVHPELSTGTVDAKGPQGTLVPNKEITQVTTNVMVRDGCTVILGGLFRNEVNTDVSQVPVLGSLPVVGALFRTRTDTPSRHEILILMTPHIVYEPDSCQEGEHAACEFHRRQAVAAEKMSPWNRHNISQKYVRMAQNAWARHDRDTALRFAEMAVQFDPEYRAAIDLRATIWQNEPDGAHTLPRPGAAPESLDGQQIPPWMLDDLPREPGDAPAVEHPLDPGRHGAKHDIVRPRKLP